MKKTKHSSARKSKAKKVKTNREVKDYNFPTSPRMTKPKK